MEHRNGARRPVNLNINLCQNGEDFGWFLGKDISPGGLSVKGKLQELENNSLLTVQIEQIIKGYAQYIELKAFVIHQDNNTIGLMWAEHHGVLGNLFQQDHLLVA
tara:strand:- start:39264 stop:39578 length:315 start_codon:yes stop_codon:yes gene_type:complete